MRYGDPLTRLATLLIVLVGLAAVVGLATVAGVTEAAGLGEVAGEPAALSILVVCLVVIAAGVAIGTRNAGPKTPYW